VRSKGDGVSEEATPIQGANNTDLHVSRDHIGWALPPERLPALFTTFLLLTTAHAVERGGCGVNDVGDDGSIGSIGAGAALVLVAMEAQDIAFEKVVAAGFVPAPGSVITETGLLVAEADTAANIIADAGRRRARREVVSKEAREAGALVGVGDMARLSRRGGPFVVVAVVPARACCGRVFRSGDTGDGEWQYHQGWD
jgi:hypothetical protein